MKVYKNELNGTINKVFKKLGTDIKHVNLVLGAGVELETHKPNLKSTLHLVKIIKNQYSKDLAEGCGFSILFLGKDMEVLESLDVIWKFNPWVANDG